MIYAICVGKRKENNVIVEYKLKDFMNKTMVLEANELKDFIKTGKLTVVNLTLTSNNKLVDFKVKDLDSLKKKEKVSKTRDENIDSIVSRSKVIDSVDLDNSFIYNNHLFYINKNNLLCVVDVNTNEHKAITERVHSATYVVKNNKVYIFAVYEHNEKYRLKIVVFNLDENKVSYYYSSYFFEEGVVIGKQAKLTNIGVDKVEDRPDYYVGNYKSQFDYVILPIKKKEGEGYSITQVIVYDIKRDHFYRAKADTKWFDSFVDVLNSNSYFIIPFNTLSSLCDKTIIQTSKLTVILTYDGSKMEFYKDC